MKIALFFEDEMLCSIDEMIEDKCLKILILEMDGTLRERTRITTEYMINQNINYISLWLLSSHISGILVSGISGNIRSLFEKMDISTKIVKKEPVNFFMNNDVVIMNDLL